MAQLSRGSRAVRGSGREHRVHVGGGEGDRVGVVEVAVNDLVP